MPVEDQFGLWTYVTNVLDWTGSGEIQDGPKAWAPKFGHWTYVTNVLDWTGSGEIQDGPKALGNTSLASGHVSFSHKTLLERYPTYLYTSRYPRSLAPANEMILRTGREQIRPRPFICSHHVPIKRKSSNMDVMCMEFLLFVRYPEVWEHVSQNSLIISSQN
jgi:hypothetical protein